jgi:AcrR family transcriptional regulator
MTESGPELRAGPQVVPAWRPSAGSRDRIVAAACELFNRAGIRAVGVDAVLERAGVALGTFYRHFPSKDALVLAFVERSDAEWRSWLAEAVAAAGTTPQERLLAVFTVLPAWFASPTFRGSPVLNAAAELDGSTPAVAELARAHNAQVHAFLTGLVEEAGRPDAGAWASRLQVLLNGAVTTAQFAADAAARRGVAADAEAVARAVLREPDGRS